MKYYKKINGSYYNIYREQNGIFEKCIHIPKDKWQEIDKPEDVKEISLFGFYYRIWLFKIIGKGY